MNFNNQYSSPFYPRGPPFNPYQIPPWFPPFPTNMPPPYMIPPFVPPPDPRMVNNPYNPLLVYQTNNYYSSLSEVQANSQNINPFFQKSIPDGHSIKRSQEAFSIPKKDIAKSTVSAATTSKVPQIIEIQSSDDVQNVMPIQREPVKRSKPIITNRKREQRQSPFRRRIVLPREKQIREDVERQFQQNLKSIQQCEPRRSQRTTKVPQRYKFLSEEEDEEEQKFEMTQPLRFSKNKLIFKYRLSESQQLQLCLSKLRQIKAQIMIGPQYQASIPKPMTSKRSKLQQIRQDLETRLLE